MLVVTQIEDDILQVKCNYHADYVKGFRQIPGRSFNRQDKVWEIPTCTLKRFEKIFPGQIIYKTPRWKILKQPMPDYPKMYIINDKSIKTPVMKCKPFKYQDFGIRYIIDRLQTSRFIIDGDGVGLGRCLQTN
jgi:hypothetical protein